MKNTSLALTVLMAAGAVLISAPPASAQVPALLWTDCGDHLQCADAKVPLDHDRPSGPKISLALARRPATDPEHRIGTLFVNDGGPGNSVVDFVAGDALSVVPADVRARFDLVGFDPRGAGRSTPLRCFPGTAEQEAFFATRPAFPVGAAETAAFTKGSKDLAAACARNAGSQAGQTAAQAASTQAGGAQGAGAQSGGADGAGAQSGGAQSGGAQSGGAQSGGAEGAGAQSGGAQSGGAEGAGAQSGGAEGAGAQSGGAEGAGARSGSAQRVDLLAHVSTANVARDLDLLRQAVGDPQLTYAGYSYGGLLGLTYANLFPGKVRALLLDGTPSPQQWTSPSKLAPVTVRVDSATATSRALDAFLTTCESAGQPSCAFAEPAFAEPAGAASAPGASTPGASASGNAPAPPVASGRTAATRAKFDTLMARLRTAPITVQTPDGPIVVTYSFLVDGLRGGLQFPPVWPFVAEQLQATWASAGTLPTTRTPRKLSDGYDNSREILLAVLCGESANPPLPGLWPVYAGLADARNPYFGADWAYLSQPCATWPVRDQDRYTGAYDRKTANPILFVNGTQDAASPIEQARAAAAAMPGARLLVVDGPGHPASFIPDACLLAATSAYLIDRRLPAQGTTCSPDSIPFES